MKTLHYQLGGLVPIPKVLQSDVSIVQRFYSPKGFYSEASIVRKRYRSTDVQKVL